MNVRRRGFTIIEILVVIGIILVLVGIVSVGITYVTKAGKNNAVKVTLNNLRGMIAELEATAGLSGRQPVEMWYDGNEVVATPANPINIWMDADPSTAGDQPAFTPSQVSQEASGGATPDRYVSDQVANTQRIMRLLLASPNNKRMFGQFPAEQLSAKVPPGVTIPIATAPKVAIDAQRNLTPAVVLDPWLNPILFVPSAGLCGEDTGATDSTSMWIGGAPGAAGARKVIASPAANSTTEAGPIRSPDGRPFWGSAGPDGDFRTADDNVYSFGN